MNEFFSKYIDLLTIVITLAWTIAASLATWKKGAKDLRWALVPLVFLGPVMLVSCMITHLAEITFHAVDSDFTGKFSLRFYLYSLYLMALVLGNAGIYMYRGAQHLLVSPIANRNKFLLPAALIVIILFPLLWLTPLSFMMYAVCAISVAASFWVRKKEQVDADLEMFTLQEATA